MEVAPEVLVRRAEAGYNALDVDRALGLFTADAVFHMNGKPVATGTDELRRWHERFFASVKEYRLSKTLRAATADLITVEFSERWVSTRDGQPREGFGGEFWTIEGDRLAEWHLYYRSWPATDAADRPNR